MTIANPMSPSQLMGKLRRQFLLDGTPNHTTDEIEGFKWTLYLPKDALAKIVHEVAGEDGFTLPAPSEVTKAEDAVPDYSTFLAFARAEVAVHLSHIDGLPCYKMFGSMDDAVPVLKAAATQELDPYNLPLKVHEALARACYKFLTEMRQPQTLTEALSQELATLVAKAHAEPEGAKEEPAENPTPGSSPGTPNSDQSAG